VGHETRSQRLTGRMIPNGQLSVQGDAPNALVGDPGDAEARLNVGGPIGYQSLSDYHHRSPITAEESSQPGLPVRNTLCAFEL
jgi:hypothetical protein